MSAVFYSFIVPVFNRPDELAELLGSLAQLNPERFEVVVVEDGSDILSDEVVSAFRGRLSIQYHQGERMGPARARNKGMSLATGEWFIFVDSDCLVPPEYLDLIDRSLEESPVDAFGGPDRAAPGFNATQQAISYAMTSFFTTGGIRGGRRQVDRFYPRSFNMGVSRRVFEETGGFPITRMHPGEDMVFSIELVRRGFTTACFYEAFVYHKRRTRFGQFFRQVFRFGKTRYIISRVYPDTFKPIYLMPSFFTMGVAGLILGGVFIHPWVLFPVGMYAFVLFSDALVRTRGVMISLLAAWASFVQLTGYGLGFLATWFRVSMLGKDEYGVLNSGFYPTGQS